MLAVWDMPRSHRGEHVTLKTIAEATGYSVTTVSRALAGYNDVAEGTRKLIIETAERLGYQPNITARQLRQKRTNTVGLILPTLGHRFSDPFFGELLAGIGHQASSNQYDLLVSTQEPGPDELDAYRRIAGGQRVDGLLIVRARERDPRIRYLQKIGLPFVVFGRSYLDQDYPYVDVNGELGLHVLTEHFIELGHRRIGYISAPPDLTFAHLRLSGYRHALEENGIRYNEQLVVLGDLSKQGGAQAAERLLALEPQPTAIIAANDLMALGVMDVLRQHGLEPGEDVAVGGFDGVPESEFSHPPLTTMRQPIYQIGQRICQMLIDLINGRPLEERHVLLQPELVIRRSSGRPIRPRDEH